MIKASKPTADNAPTFPLFISITLLIVLPIVSVVCNKNGIEKRALEPCSFIVDLNFPKTFFGEIVYLIVFNFLSLVFIYSLVASENQSRLLKINII